MHDTNSYYFFKLLDFQEIGWCILKAEMKLPSKKDVLVSFSGIFFLSARSSEILDNQVSPHC